MLDREERGGTAGRDADLRLDVLRVVICGLGGDHEPVGDLPGGEAGCQQPEHLGITGGQSGRERGAGGATVTCCGQHPLSVRTRSTASPSRRPAALIARSSMAASWGACAGAIRAIRHVMA